jgi:hypothetical protein
LRSTQIQLTSTATGVRGQVTVQNQDSAAVPGATVAITWTLPGGGLQSKTAKSNSLGIAAFTVAGGSGTYTLTVTNITKAGHTFDPANSVLTKSITK